MTKHTTNQVYLHLGSNVGDKLKNILYAIYKINEDIGTVTDQSSIWVTGAWGVEDQPDFLNTAIKVETPLEPQELLKTIHVIEDKLGRVRLKRWGNRTIDIDIIFFNNVFFNANNLTIPHKFMSERNFVLHPLAEICPNYVHPLLGKTVNRLKDECTDQGRIDLFKPNI